MEIQQYVTQQQIAHDCPICGHAVYHNPEYPNQVCNACLMYLQDNESRPIMLFPSDYWMNHFEARCRHDDQIRHDRQEGYVHGVQCNIKRGPGSSVIVEKV